MARINLRPWREELRAERQRQFLVAMAGVAVAGVIYILLADRVISSTVDTQNQRNTYLTQEIAQLDERIKEIAELQQRRDGLIERMRVIQELQGNRPVIVHIFDELVRKLPDGVHFTSLERRGEQLAFKGLAESNNRISSLMRSLDSSAWFEGANLSSVTEVDQPGGVRASQFDLTVRRSTASTAQGNGG